jgi:ADP-ribosylglycohydrolase
MISDDTEHACMTAQALIRSAAEPELFGRKLAWSLRLWLLGLPAGIGWATLRSLFRLWAGFSPDRSGVYSAGNGPAMRSPVLGAAMTDLEKLGSLVRVSTRLTHTDPRAEGGALIVALAANQSSSGRVSPGDLLDTTVRLQPGIAPELVRLVEAAAESALRGEETIEFARAIGLERGVTGFILHTVPVALHAWILYPESLPDSLRATVRCGGDTDTVAAITGGIVGARPGNLAIPKEWFEKLAEWPRSPEWIESLGPALARVLVTGKPERGPSLPAAAVLLRNAFFLGVVLTHGFRRLLPPY